MNSLYPKAAQKFMTAGINLATDTIKIAMVDASYVYSNTHEFFSSAATAVVNTPSTLLNKTTTDGVFDADNITFTSVTGNPITALIIYKDTGVATTSPVILYLDQVGNLPITPNTGSLTFAFSDEVTKIFAFR